MYTTSGIRTELPPITRYKERKHHLIITPVNPRFHNPNMQDENDRSMQALNRYDKYKGESNGYRMQKFEKTVFRYAFDDDDSVVSVAEAEADFPPLTGLVGSSNADESSLRALRCWM